DGLGITASAADGHEPFQLHVETSALKAVRAQSKPSVVGFRDRIGIGDDAPRNLLDQYFRGTAGCMIAEAAEVLLQPVPHDELPGAAATAGPARTAITNTTPENEIRIDED